MARLSGADQPGVVWHPIQRFDLHTWQWRNATYQQPYGRTVGLIIGLASGAGALTAGYFRQFTGQAPQFGLMAGIFICFGIFGIWSMIEGIWYLWFFRHQKRVKHQ